MNNFEQRKFLDYLSKLLPETDTNSYSFDEVFDFMVQEFNIDRSLFHVDESGTLCLENSRLREDFAKTMKKVIKILASKIKKKNTFLEKQLLIIKDIFSLNDNEYEFLVFFALKAVNNVFNKYFSCINGNQVSTFAKVYLNMRCGQKERLVESLYMKNIIASRRSEEINDIFLKILDNPKCITVNKIISTLLGVPIKARLSSSDFSYLQKDRDIVVNLLKSAVANKTKGMNILLYGDVGTGKTEFAKLVANLAKVPLFSVISQKECYKEADREDRLVDLCSKQHILSRSTRACLLFDEGEDVMNRGFNSYGGASKGYLNTLLESTAVPIIWTTNNIYDVDPAFLRRMTYCIEFEKLSEDTRLNVWKKILKKNKFKVSNKKVVELNKNYEISPSIIANAIQSTKLIDGNENDFENFIETVARVVTKKKNVKSKREFEMKDYDENLINTDIDIKNLTSRIKQAGKLNFSLCLYGEAGTGKSLYARYLANELGVEVILKRASDLISSYVGQTEQNIASAFAEAKAKKAMLIFDEADTFLQNRNNAIRSWEVAQVNEMLTWMESHEYPFVCTTNLFETLDEASLRRFTFKIKFDFLTNQQVSDAIEHFFGLDVKEKDINLKGLTAGDFSTVKKKTDFLGINDIDEILDMLAEEVKVKKSKVLQNSVGF